MKRFDTIVALIRRDEITLIGELARQLRREGPAEGAHIKYVALWQQCIEPLQAACEPGDEVVDHFARIGAVPRATSADFDWLHAFDGELLEATGIPLGPRLDAERFRPPQADRALDFLYRHARYADDLIGERTVVIGGAIDQLVYWLFCDLANMRGGAYFGFMRSGRPSGSTQVMRSSDTLWAPFQPTEAHRAEADRQVELIRTGQKPDYMHIEFERELTTLERAQNRMENVKEVRRGNYLASVYLVPGRIRAMSDARWRAHLKIMRPRSVGQLNRPYVYFPLHLDPEATTLVFAPLQVDQAYVIDALSRYLPAGIDLVVKENPKMWGQRPKRFYQRVAETRAIWIDPKTPSEQLIQGARATLSITGTTAIEAALLGRDVAILARPPWHSLMRCVPRIDVGPQMGGPLRALCNGAMHIDDEVFRAQYARFVANVIGRPLIQTEVTAGWRAHPYDDSFATYCRAALAMHVADEAG